MGDEVPLGVEFDKIVDQSIVNNGSSEDFSKQEIQRDEHIIDL